LETAVEQAIQNFLTSAWMAQQMELPEIVPSSYIDSMKFLDKKDFTATLESELRKSLMQTLNPMLKRDYPQLQPRTLQMIEWIYFQDMKENGHADGYRIGLTTRYLDSFVEGIKEEIFTFLIDGLVWSVEKDDADLTPEQQRQYYKYYRTGGASIIRALSGHSKKPLTDRIMYRLHGPVSEMISTLIHEVVHVLQHRAQQNKPSGTGGTEYRSYLDTRKGELKDLLSKYHSQRDFKDERWDRLYYASPQEIGAFAHNIALRIVRDFGFNLPDADLTVSFTAKDFVDALRSRIGDQYRDPNNPREQAVLKRYLKLAYQEVQRYIEQRRKQQQQS
jgi:hypothetical protein